MTVAFWSNTRGKACVTSNLACISVLSSLGSRKNDKTILLENHQNIVNLGSALFSQYSKSMVWESRPYHKESGLSYLLRMIEWDNLPSDEVFQHITEDLLGKKLLYLSAEGTENAEVLEYTLEKEYQKAICYLEEQGNCVMIDTSAAPLPSSRIILNEADLVVVNLSQNRQVLEHFFHNYSHVRSKAFYLIGDYDGESEWEKEKIMRRYNIPKTRIGTIPHNAYFADAMLSGNVIPFLLDNYDCFPSSPNYSFIQEAKQAVTLLKKQISKKKRQ